MNNVLITSESRYPVRRKNIKQTVEKFFKEAGLSDVEISILIVGSRKVRQLNKQWRDLDESTTVLTFSPEEPRGLDGVLLLGDIVISYPQAREIALAENLTMDKAIDKLLVHGLNNLIGRY